MGYKSQALKGVSWMSFLRVFTRGISILKTAIIARILSPSQFGIFAIATLLFTIIETFTETAINAFLIQEKDPDKYINSAWTTSILRGIIIFFLIVFSAGFISSFFNSSSAYVSILLISIVPLLRGFINPKVVFFQKELNFKKEFVYRSSIFFVEAFVSTLFVILFKSPEALVWGLIAGAVHEVLVSNLAIKSNLRLNFDLSILRKIISRGKWLTAGGVFDYLFYNVDNIVIGKILGTSALGLYDMAYTISSLPITEIGETVAKVNFPIFVKISEDIERMKKAYLKTSVIIILITFPIGLILFLFPKEIILIFLGRKWIEMASVLQVLAIFGFIRSVTNPSGAVFLAIKKQEYIAYTTFSGSLVLVATIVPFVYYFGIIGAGYSAVLSSIVQIPILVFFLIKIFRNKKYENNS